MKTAMFGRSITLFRLFGFEVRLDASWLFIAALVTWSLASGFFPRLYPGFSPGTYLWMGIAGAFLLFASIIAHELSHAVVARRYHIQIKGITLFIFGGVAEMENEPPTAKSELLMAAAGPIASILVGFVFFVMHAAGRSTFPLEALAVLAYLYWVNWVLAVFNLIPAFPLDGGRILRSALWHRRGDLVSATRTASKIGSGFGAVMMVLAVLQLFIGNFIGAVWWFMIGMFLRMISQNSYAQVVLRSTLKGEPVSRFMRSQPDTVSPDASIEELVNEHVYRYHHKLFPVVSDSNRLEGCVTTEQIKHVPREEWPAHKVAEIAKPCSPENTISPETDSMDAIKLMTRSGNTKLMVVEEQRLVAIVALRDLLNFLASKLELEGKDPGLGRGLLNNAR